MEWLVEPSQTDTVRRLSNERIEFWVNRILFEVCDTFEVTEGALLSSCRKRPLPQARSICYLLMRTQLGMSLKQIGGKFSRHHSTIIHGLTCANEENEIDPEFTKLYNKIKGAVFQCFKGVTM